MARIRTIKPEFWTDEKLVQLPIAARLFFIGLWNFCDDYGTIEDNPDRLRLQIMPADPTVDVSDILDLLVVVGILERYRDTAGNSLLVITNWSKHQKVDNPSKIRISREGYRKLAIPQESRRAVAKKYGCAPGESCYAECYYCGTPGSIHWHRRSNGQPSAWVSFSELELDHVEPEHQGGDNSGSNLVLACRTCNRSKGHADMVEWLQSSRALASPSEGSPLEGKGKDQERNTIDASPRPVDRFPDFWESYPVRAGDRKRKEAENKFRLAVKSGVPPDRIILGAKKYRDYCQATGKLGTELVQQAPTWLNGQAWENSWEVPNQAKPPGYARPPVVDATAMVAR